MPRYRSSTKKRRFIAGAVCPKCHHHDSIVWHQTHQAQWIQCINCGYREDRPGSSQPTEHHQQTKPAPSIQVINIDINTKKP